jgi:beta-RFAP synthase
MVHAHGVALSAGPARSKKLEDFLAPFYPEKELSYVKNDQEPNGFLADRVEAIIAKLRQHPDAPALPDSWTFRVKRAPPLHQGWGTGTQLALAAARLWWHLAGASDWDACRAAKCLGRGLRSGIGVAGFDHGGFLIDRGKRPDDPNPSQVEHIALPKEWAWLLVEPRFESGVHGEAERVALASIKPDIGVVKELMHLGQTILPQAAREKNFAAFTEALSRYNRLAGAFYRELQGGNYSSAAIEARIELLRAQGAVGVGQSSWGPGVFCLFPDLKSAINFEGQCKIADCKMLHSWTSEGTQCYPVDEFLPGPKAKTE